MASYKTAKVLLVDDNSINLYIIGKILEECNIAADYAYNGKSCIKKVENKKYDLIFMDHMMPDMDGIETFKILHENPDFNTPVVVLTANDGDEYEKIYKEIGFAAYLYKPVNNEIIYSILEKFLSCKLDKENLTKDEAFSGNDLTFRKEKLKESGFIIIDELLANGMSITDFEILLSIFCEDSSEKLLKADEYVNDNNLREYAVIVHGLKNDAGMISELELQEEALSHEIESKAGNESFVKRNWPKLKANWQKLIDRINKYFA